MLSLVSAAGLAGGKLKRLHAVADAALDGRFDSDRLRAMGPDDALASLHEIHGIDLFQPSSSSYTVRAPSTCSPIHEQRLHRATRYLHGVPDSSPHELAQLAAQWSPFPILDCFPDPELGDINSGP